MAKVAQPQPQQTGTPEMWDDINKKPEEKNVGSRISGNQNSVMKFIADFSYLCLFTAEWILIKWICNAITSNENIKDAKVIVKKDENDSSAKHGSKITFQEEDKKVKAVTPTSTPWDENTTTACQHAEASIPPVTTTSSAPTL